MQFRKLTTDKIVAGQIYVAYSAKNKILSSNSGAGVFVKALGVTAGVVNLEVLGTGKNTKIAKLNEREDAFMYDPMGSSMLVTVRCEDVTEWPTFTKRMVDTGLNGTSFKFDNSELYTNDREDSPGFGETLLRHNGGSKHPETGEEITDNYRINWIVPTEVPEWRIPRAQRMGLGSVEIALPPKPVSAEDQVIIDSLSVNIKEIKSEGDKTACCAFSIIYEDNIDRQYSRECHSALNYQQKDSKYMLSLHSRITADRGHPITDEISFHYISYLTNYSPFKDAFIIKDTQWIIDNCYVMSTDVSGNLLGGAAIATRQLWEYPDHVWGWWWLMEQGISPDLAFALGQMAVTKNNGTKLKFSDTGGGHSPLALSNMDDKAIINFVKHKPSLGNKDSYKKKPKYSLITGQWGEGGFSAIAEQLGDIKSGGGYDNYLLTDDVIDQAVDLIDVWGEENIK